MRDKDDAPAVQAPELERATVNRGGTWRREPDGTLTCIEQPTAPPGYIYDNNGQLQPLAQPAA